jgi:nucleoside-triphosphatase
MRLADLLTDRRVSGFYTDEIRERGHRFGFRATTLAGESCVLAHMEIQSRQRVGRYGVDVGAFEQLVIPELGRQCDIALIDEIGKMECFSSPFVEAVRQLLDSTTPLMATIAVSGGGFIAEAKSRSDVATWTVTQANRGKLPQALLERLSAL